MIFIGVAHTIRHGGSLLSKTEEYLLTQKLVGIFGRTRYAATTKFQVAYICNKKVERGGGGFFSTEADYTIN